MGLPLSVENSLVRGRQPWALMIPDGYGGFWLFQGRAMGAYRMSLCVCRAWVGGTEMDTHQVWSFRECVFVADLGLSRSSVGM